MLFSTPFTCQSWHNFAIVVDWDNLTLAVFYSVGARPLKLVSPAKENQGAKAAPDGQGEFHFGVLKVHSLYFGGTASADKTFGTVTLS